MSKDVIGSVILGFLLDLDEITAIHPAVMHEEKRFDPKTGEEIEPETVVDEDEGRYFNNLKVPKELVEFHGSKVMVGDPIIVDVVDHEIKLHCTPIMNDASEYAELWGSECYVVGVSLEDGCNIGHIQDAHAELVRSLDKVNKLFGTEFTIDNINMHISAYAC